MMKCPCHSGKTYEECCQPLHQGEPAPTALALMRSRYCGYALNLPDYIIATTHPKSPLYLENIRQWKEQIAQFSQNCLFEDLKILHVEEKENHATVTFIAHLSQQGKDVSFQEKSSFEKIHGKWLYHSGQIS